MAKGKVDIVGFVNVREYSSKEWCDKRGLLRIMGHVFHNGGDATEPCPFCKVDFVVGIYTTLYGNENDAWYQHCVACGRTVEERAVYESEAVHV